MTQEGAQEGWLSEGFLWRPLEPALAAIPSHLSFGTWREHVAIVHSCTILHLGGSGEVGVTLPM